VLFAVELTRVSHSARNARTTPPSTAAATTTMPRKDTAVAASGGQRLASSQRTSGATAAARIHATRTATTTTMTRRRSQAAPTTTAAISRTCAQRAPARPSGPDHGDGALSVAEGGKGVVMSSLLMVLTVPGALAAGGV